MNQPRSLRARFQQGVGIISLCLPALLLCLAPASNAQTPGPPAPQPVLKSPPPASAPRFIFEPDSGAAGDNVTLTGSDFGLQREANTVTFSGLPAPVVSLSTSNKLTVKVPDGAVTGRISVTNLTTASSGTSEKDFVVTSPAIRGCDPLSQFVANTVTVTGFNLLSKGGSPPTVTLNGIPAKVSAVPNPSNTALAVVVPPGVPSGPSAIVIQSDRGQHSWAHFTVLPPPQPQITRFDPPSGALGQQVKIIGVNFDTVTKENNVVKFNGVTATVQEATPGPASPQTELRVSVPDLRTATVESTKLEVTVGTKAGVATSKDFSYSGPVITSVTPLTGAVGQPVTIKGLNLYSQDATTTVSIGNKKATLSSNPSAAQLSVVVPPDAASGAVTVNTTTGSATSTESFTVTTGGTVIANSQGLGQGDRMTLQTFVPGFVAKVNPTNNTAVAPPHAYLEVTSNAVNGKVAVQFIKVGAQADLKAYQAKLHAFFGEDAQFVTTDIVYEVSVNDLESGYPVTTKGIAFGVLLVPYKFHFTDHSLSGASTIGGYAGWHLGFTALDVSAIAAAGVGVVNVTSTAAGGAQTTSNAASFTGAAGVITTFKKNSTFQLGIVVGADWTGKGTNYSYEGKPWFALSFGVNLTK
jgi:hypothetical protein